ncbi:MAG: DNA polymerase I [Synergistaceae bacterium]|nr:DNA polymerase I [Synergistaceae bacterium]
MNNRQERQKRQKILLIDGHGLLFRAFYALPITMKAPDGTPTGALTGFANMLKGIIDTVKPIHTAVFFDAGGSDARKNIFRDYKATRKPTPDEIKIQTPLAEEFCRLAGYAVKFEVGVEADDLIISTAKNLEHEGYEVLILTSDKDLMQTITDHITILRPKKGVNEFATYTPQTFFDERGFEPSKIADVLAIMGDTADNVPGVHGIGEKGANDLVKQFGTLDEIYEQIEEVKGVKQTYLREGKEAAYLSLSLVLPQPTAPLATEEILKAEMNATELGKFCDRLALRKIKQDFLNEKDLFLSSFENFALKNEPTTKNKTTAKANETIIQENIFESVGIEEAHFIECDLVALLEANKKNLLALDFLERDASKLLLISNDKNYTVVSLDNEKKVEALNNWHNSDGIFILESYPKFIETLEDKNSTLRLNFYNIICLATHHYLLHPDNAGQKWQEKGGYTSLHRAVSQKAKLFSYFELSKKLALSEKLINLKNTLDMPLASVLLNMKRNGLFVDVAKLKALELELQEAIAKKEKEVFTLTGQELNLASPKQVRALLFETLGLPAIKKIKTGYSTSIEVMEELARLPEPFCLVPQAIIEYRELTKIYSSFVEPFLKFALDEIVKGREPIIHSTFDHLATGTGRLASYNPNVQNMPQFGNFAKSFRSCFIPRKESHVFVSADYSQIELRVLASVTGEEKLKEAFAKGQDIHKQTACMIYGYDESQIGQEERRVAKTVNFGLIYGISAFGLSEKLGIPRREATSLSERYFDALPNVKAYIKDAKKKGQERATLESIFGRIRPTSEIVMATRGNSPYERICQNSPIQSAASDIAKIALIKFEKVLSEQFPKAKIILQIHDSIVCECDEFDAEAVKKILVSTMESIRAINVPLVAEPKIGKNLAEV